MEPMPEGLGSVGDYVYWVREQARIVEEALSELDRVVAGARAAGATWEDIGEATGRTKQAAHYQWGPLRQGESPR